LTVERILSWVPMVGILSQAFSRFCPRKSIIQRKVYQNKDVKEQ
jgi:hypothetical protein